MSNPTNDFPRAQYLFQDRAADIMLETAYRSKPLVKSRISSVLDSDFLDCIGSVTEEIQSKCKVIVVYPGELDEATTDFNHTVLKIGHNIRAAVFDKVAANAPSLFGRRYSYLHGQLVWPVIRGLVQLDLEERINVQYEQAILGKIREQN